MRRDFTFVENMGKRVKLGGRNLMHYRNINYADEESMVSNQWESLVVDSIPTEIIKTSSTPKSNFVKKKWSAGLLKIL